jgi:hypothetical protein
MRIAWIVALQPVLSNCPTLSGVYLSFRKRNGLQEEWKHCAIASRRLVAALPVCVKALDL